MTTTNLTQANRELFHCVPDERFPTLQSLWNHCALEPEQSVECWTDLPESDRCPAPTDSIWTWAVKVCSG